MGFISGNTVKSTRFKIVAQPPTVNFDACPFREIEPGSSLRTREGFLPFDVYDDGSPHYEIEHGVYAFRFRIDTATIDNGLLKEKMAQQVRASLHAGMPVGAKQRAQIKLSIIQEMMEAPAIRTRIIEGIIYNRTLYLGTVAKSQIGTVLNFLKQVGIEVEFMTPWGDDPGDYGNTPLTITEPGQSLYGVKFLRKLLDYPDVLVEPESGSVKLLSSDGAKISLTGSVMDTMNEALDNGAYILSAKLIFNEYELTLDGFTYRINNLKMGKPEKSAHWTEKALARLEVLRRVWSLLDERYAAMSLA